MSNSAPLPSRSAMFSISVFNGDDDFPFTGELEDGPSFPLYEKTAYHSGCSLMTAIGSVMSLAAIKAISRHLPYLVLTVNRLDGKPFMWDEQTIVAQWLWKFEDQMWMPYATGGPHPIPGPPF